MRGDFSRVTFDPRNHFSTVLFQQGRVSVDADANEQAAILRHYLRTLAVDLLGRHAWPSADAGFEVELVTDAGRQVDDLLLGPGRCYIDGVLVENPEPTTYADRSADRLGGDLRAPPYFVYLEVWERLITSVEQPEIRDVALGVDTSVRTKVVWRARVSGPLTDGSRPTGDDKAATLAHWAQHVEPGLGVRGTGALVADVRPAGGGEPGYRGAENQLYRVEIHTAGVLGAADGPPPTFKWSRENGSVVLPIERRAANVLALGQLGRDDRHGLHVGDWVELSDDAGVLSGGDPAPLRRVAGIDAGGSQVTLDAAPEEATGSDPGGHPLLRRWDQQPAAGEQSADGAIRVGVDAVPLENGIEVTFEPGRYRAGDYWLIPARVATADIEWPRSPAPVARSAVGVERSYVPIAYVTQASEVQDLRLFVAPVAR